MDSNLIVNDYGNMLAAVVGSPQEGGGLGMAKIVAWLIFGAIGFVAFAYGKKMGSMQPMILGAVLMVYPYFVTGTWPLYIIGIALAVALSLWRG
jgi:hypothetical protein